MINEINIIMQQAKEAFDSYRCTTLPERKKFLFTIADEIEKLGDELLETAAAETNLPIKRFIGERGRTCQQLRMFGDYVVKGNFVRATIDTAVDEGKDTYLPDMRSMYIPIGPIVVFGASNFPLAYSTPGGDTASALAAGCSVIVKGHPAHPNTSALVKRAFENAMVSCNIHPNTFQLVAGQSFEIGQHLVKHPITSGVGFTGSLHGGRALFDIANARPKPIPVFSEMGSTNPVVLCKHALQTSAALYANKFAQSITLGVGQFCTNPGIMIGVKGSSLNHFTHLLALELAQIKNYEMLHEGIIQNFNKRLEEILYLEGIETVYHSHVGEGMKANTVLVRVKADTFLQNAPMHEEVFGPFSMIIVCENKAQVREVYNSIEGQLTATFIANDSDIEENLDLIEMAKGIAGRVLFNEAPTGVAVRHATMHGGPYPATTDSRFTSVGTSAIDRWLRPVCHQNWPSAILPEALQDSNPLRILRLIDGVYTTESISK